ncbi:MAG: ankyrin repeat domain-containing protein [Chryseolinea sp.]
MATLKDLLQYITSDNTIDLELALDQDPSLNDAKTEQGISLLQLAIYYRKPEMVRVLRSRRSTIDVFEAAAIGEINAVRDTLTSKPELINSYAADGFTPLGLACFFGHFDIAQYLVNAGADVNLASNNAFKVAPIHSSCSISSFELTELLLKNNANVNATQQQGVTPLHGTAHNGNHELTKLLIEYGADLGAKTDGGKTPLDMAVEKADIILAESLRG